MTKSTFEINTKISPVNYESLVKAIFEGYFDENNKYVPEHGILNVMNLFYNLCVVRCNYDQTIPHSNTDLLSLLPVLEDDEFIDCFNESIKCNNDDFHFTFSCAFRDAINKIDFMNGSLDGMITSLGSTLIEFLKDTSELITKENIEKLTDIAGMIASGQINFDKIIESYSQSSAFSNVVQTNSINSF